MNVLTYRTVHCRTYKLHIDFDFETLGVPAGSWLGDLVRRCSSESRFRRAHHKDTWDFHHGLSVLGTNPDWLRAISSSPSDLDIKDVALAYRWYENYLLDSDFSKRANAMFSTFRRHIKQYFFSRKDCPQFALLHATFRPRRSAIRHHPRALISDLPSSLEPIGATPHESLADLKAKVTGRLDADLRKIESACIYEFERFEAQVAWLHSIRSLDIPPDQLSRINDAIKAERSVKNTELDAIEPKYLLSRYLAYAHGRSRQMAHRPLGSTWLVGSKRVLEFAKSNMPLSSPVAQGDDLVHMPFIGHARVTLSCLLLLQLHTRWNVSSVLSLTSDDVADRAEAVVIQGFKSRTDDHTPPVVVTKADRGAYLAIAYLRNRLQQLKRLDRCSKSEKSLWHSSGRVRKARGLVLTGLWKELPQFQSDHSLPRFSFEQVRVQGLARLSVSKDGLEAARHAGGHVRPSTTAHYLDQILLQRLNSSINLEFQRTLEASVEYDINWAPARPELVAQKKPVRANLLHPIGDGASCTDPFSPPEDDWLKHGVCAAERCHAGSGCSHRRLVVDSQRIEEVVATTLFYERNWRRIEDANPEAFVAKHLPSLVFNLAFYGVLERGPFGHLVRDAEKGLRNAG